MRHVTTSDARFTQISAASREQHRMVFWIPCLPLCCFPCPSPRKTVTGVVTIIKTDYTCQISQTANYEDPESKEQDDSKHAKSTRKQQHGRFVLDAQREYELAMQRAAEERRRRGMERAGDFTFKFWEFMHEDGVYPKLVKMTPEIKQFIETELAGSVVRFTVQLDNEMCDYDTHRTIVNVDDDMKERLHRVRDFLMGKSEGPPTEAIASVSPSAPPIAVPVVK